MKKKALRKTIIREILSSKSRFFSIIGIIMLGVAFYVGIKATGPDMLKTVNKYYDEQSLMDLKIVSTLGLDDKDLAILKNNREFTRVQASKSLDVNLVKDSRTMRLLSIDSQIKPKEQLNKFVVSEGRLPKKTGEIALDVKAKNIEKYQMGDTYQLVTDKETTDKLKTTSYKIVGFVYSPEYIEKTSRGQTTVGKGTIDYFGVITQADFNLEGYTEIYLQAKSLAQFDAYSEKYEDKLAKITTNLKNDFIKRPDEKLSEIKVEAQPEIDEATKKLNQAQKELQEAQQKLERQKSELNEGTKQIENARASGADQVPAVASQLKEQEKTIAEGKVKLSEAQEKLSKETKTLESKQAELSDKIAELADLKVPEYFFFNRDDNPGYLEYNENAERISSIATVFPVFFFMIAALICLTTMTRMVEEKRSEIGTLKALGYSNFEISKKYVVYAVATTIIGTILGLVIGFNLFPRVIFNAYGAMYDLPNVVIGYFSQYAVESFVVSIICTLVSTLVVLRFDLFSKPAELMRPKAPQAGKRILLERVPFLWKRLNFNWKVTVRNLFRYKQRMFMTIFGVAGCMALMVTGFGVKDSISDIVNIQYNKLWHYQGIVTKDQDLSKEEQQKLETLLADTNVLKDQLSVMNQSFTAKTKEILSQNVSLQVPENPKKMSEFVSLSNRQTGKVYHLDDSGVLVTEKLAKLLHLEEGDNFEMKDVDNHLVKFKVAGIVENYSMHYVYATPSYYQKVTGKEPKFYTSLISLTESLSSKQENQLASNIMKIKPVINVSFISDASKYMTDMIDSLNIVVWVLIISAGLLAFIVLYNLTNINVSERIRELSTIKVLGFYPKEVTMYVYRENNVLTFVGVIVGGFLGKFLHNYVLQTAEIDMIMFPPTVHWVSYLYSAILTFVFSTIVMWVMHRKLKKVDMIEALKSNE